jgi:hypothetical protein
MVWIQLGSKWQFPWMGAKPSDPQKGVICQFNY